MFSNEVVTVRIQMGLQLHVFKTCRNYKFLNEVATACFKGVSQQHVFKGWSPSACLKGMMQLRVFKEGRNYMFSKLVKIKILKKLVKKEI